MAKRASTMGEKSINPIERAKQPSSHSLLAKPQDKDLNQSSSDVTKTDIPKDLALKRRQSYKESRKKFSTSE